MCVCVCFNVEQLACSVKLVCHLVLSIVSKMFNRFISASSSSVMMQVECYQSHVGMPQTHRYCWLRRTFLHVQLEC